MFPQHFRQAGYSDSSLPHQRTTAGPIVRTLIWLGGLLVAIMLLGSPGLGGCTARADGGAFCPPTEGRITQRFSAGHMAMDISGGDSGHKGNPVYAPYPGTVVFVGNDPAARSVNHIVAIKHDPIPGLSQNVLSLFVHLGTSAGNISYIQVAPGARVEAGSLIGYQGDAGNSLGVHVHWSVHEFPAGKPFLDRYTHWGNGGCKRTDIWWELFGGEGCGANTNRATIVNPEQHTGTLATDVRPVCAKPVPQGYVDRPTPGAALSGTSRIDGWASVSGTTIARVEIVIDGAVHGNAVYGTARPDAGGNVGWYYDWDTTTAGNGGHTIQARAVAANGESRLLISSASAAAGSTLSVSVNNQPQTPAAPDGLAVQASGAGGINLSWRDNASNEQGYYIYKWHCTESGCDWQRVASLGAGATGYSEQDLLCGVSYFYDVSAFNAAGESPRAGWVQHMTAACTPPRPVGLHIEAGDSTRITMAWSDIADNEDGYYLYKWICAESGCDWQRYATLAPNTTTFADDAVGCNNTFYYDVSAFNAMGESPRAGWVQQVIGACPPRAPSALSVTGADLGPIQVSWSDVADNEDGYYLYKWICAESGCDWQRYTTLAPNATTFADNTIACGVSYFYDVSAFNAAGESPRAGWGAWSAPPCGLQRPAGLRVSVASSSGVTIDWTDTSSEELGYYIYKWICAESGCDWQPYATLGPGSVSFTDNVVTCGVTYFYDVSAFDAAGESPRAGWVEARTEDCGPDGPAPPSLQAAGAMQGGPGSAFRLTARGFTPGSLQVVTVDNRRVGVLRIGVGGEARLVLLFSRIATTGEYSVRVGAPAAGARLAEGAGLIITIDADAAVLPMGERAPEEQLFYATPTVFLPSVAK